MKCVSYTRTLPWKNHQGELAIAEQNQRIAAYLAEHKELDSVSYTHLRAHETG